MDAEKKQSMVLLLGKKRCRANFVRHPGAVRRDGRFIAVWLLVLMSRLAVTP